MEGVEHNCQLPLLQVLIEVLPRREGILPHLHLTAVVDGETQLSERHMQLVHAVGVG